MIAPFLSCYAEHAPHLFPPPHISTGPFPPSRAARLLLTNGGIMSSFQPETKRKNRQPVYKGESYETCHDMDCRGLAGAGPCPRHRIGHRDRGGPRSLEPEPHRGHL